MIRSDSIEVFVQINGLDVRAGLLFFHSRKGQRSTFQYDSDYVASPDAYSLDPALPLSAGSFQSAGATFSAFSDAAPDRWGRILIERRERQRARRDGTPVHTVLESRYVLGANDLTRQGAIRFRRAGEQFFSAAADSAVPTVVSLPELLHAADRVAEDDDTALKILLDAGSASLGGARPKTAVRDDEGLLLAKFPHASDTWDVMAWEKTALDLAELAGIRVPSRRLLRVSGRHVLLVRRFDRLGERRSGYMSARTLLESVDDHADYQDVAEAVELVTTEATEDLHELWRRILFSILINNTDDHLRNHGMLRIGHGWRLSPAFDINPHPDRSKARVTSIYGETRGAQQLRALQELAPQFRLNTPSRVLVEGQVHAAVGQWRRKALENGLTEQECVQMSGAFAVPADV